MAHQMDMEAENEIRGGSFDWRIEKFLLNKHNKMQSTRFKLGTDECLLRIYGMKDSCSQCRYHASPVYLKSLKNFTFDQNTIYKLSLITPDDEYLLTERIPLNTNATSVLPLTILDDYKFNVPNNDYLPDGVLHLRLAWDEVEDCAVQDQDDTNTTPVLTSEEKSIKCLETLSTDFSRFYESNIETDCVLRVGEAKFSVHRQVLSARSEVFKAMFLHDTSESSSAVVDIPEVNRAVLDDVLHYIYSGQIRELTPLTAAPMFDLANKYALVELRGICLELLKCNIMIENVCEAAVVAHVHEEIDLINKIVLFIEEKLEELEETVEWQNFSETEPLLAVKLLSSALMTCKKNKSSAK